VREKMQGAASAAIGAGTFLAGSILCRLLLELEIL